MLQVYANLEDIVNQSLAEVFELDVVLGEPCLVVFALVFALDAVGGVHFVAERLWLVAEQLLHVFIGCQDLPLQLQRRL